MSLITPNSLSGFNVVRRDHCTKFVESVMRFFIHEDNLDLIFICEKRVMVKAHKIVIASVSRFIKDLILTEKDVVYISLPGVDDRKLRLLIHFLYEGISKISQEELIALKEVMLVLDIRLPEAEIRPINFANICVTDGSISNYTNGEVNVGILNPENEFQDPLQPVAPPMIVPGNLFYFQNDGTIVPYIPPSGFVQVKQELNYNGNEFDQTEENSELVNCETVEPLPVVHWDGCDVSKGRQIISTNNGTEELAITGENTEAELSGIHDGPQLDSEYEEFSGLSDSEINEPSSAFHIEKVESLLQQGEITENVNEVEHIEMSSGSGVSVNENSMATDTCTSELEKKEKTRVGCPKVFTEQQKMILMQVYKETKSPDGELFEKLSKQLKQPKQSINNWFRFRRHLERTGKLKNITSNQSITGNTDEHDETSSGLNVVNVSKTSGTVGLNVVNVSKTTSGTVVSEIGDEKRVRTCYPKVLTEKQKTILMEVYKKTKFPDRELFEKLCRQLKEPKQRINNWFKSIRRLEKTGKLKAITSNKSITGSADQHAETSSGLNVVKVSKTTSGTVKTALGKKIKKRYSRRTIFTEKQCTILREAYNEVKSPNRQFIKKLSKQLNQPENRIYNWFCNRRYLEKTGRLNIATSNESVIDNNKNAEGHGETSSGLNVVKDSRAASVTDATDLEKNSGSKPGRPKLLTEEQSLVLENEFKRNKSPDTQCIQDLSKRLNMSQKSIWNWFSNRRHKNIGIGKNGKLKRRRHQKLFLEDRIILEHEYKKNKSPDLKYIQGLAIKLKKPLRSVYNWFCIRRYRENRGNTKYVSNKVTINMNSGSAVRNDSVGNGTSEINSADRDSVDDSTLVSRIVTANTEMTTDKPGAGISMSATSVPLVNPTGKKIFKKSDNIPKNLLSCNTCGGKFLTSVSLKSHICWKPKPYKCIYCDASFVTAEGCKIHIRLHEGKRPYKCAVCKKTFNQTPHLRIHMKQHIESTENTLKYKTTYQNVEFNRKNTLSNLVPSKDIGETVKATDEVVETTLMPNSVVTNTNVPTDTPASDFRKPPKHKRGFFITAEKKRILEKEYENNKFPTDEKILAIAKYLEYRSETVSSWFYYKRRMDFPERTMDTVTEHVSNMQPGKPVFDKEKRKILEALFRESRFPSAEMKRDIAKDLGVSLKTVSNWFVFRRWKEKNKTKSTKRTVKYKARNVNIEFNRKNARSNSVQSKDIGKTVKVTGEIMESTSTSNEAVTNTNVSTDTHASDFGKPVLHKRRGFHVKGMKKIILENEYEKDKFPSDEKISAIAKKLGFRSDTVLYWFNYKRRIDSQEVKRSAIKHIRTRNKTREFHKINTHNNSKQSNNIGETVKVTGEIMESTSMLNKTVTNTIVSTDTPASGAGPLVVGNAETMKLEFGERSHDVNTVFENTVDSATVSKDTMLPFVLLNNSETLKYNSHFQDNDYSNCSDNDGPDKSFLQLKFDPVADSLTSNPSQLSTSAENSGLLGAGDPELMNSVVGEACDGAVSENNVDLTVNEIVPPSTVFNNSETAKYSEAQFVIESKDYNNCSDDDEPYADIMKQEYAPVCDSAMGSADQSRNKDLRTKKKVEINHNHHGKNLFSNDDRIILEGVYASTRTPSADCITDLSTRLYKPRHSIYNWFANKRKKNKKDSPYFHKNGTHVLGSHIHRRCDKRKFKYSENMFHCDSCGKKFLTKVTFKYHSCTENKRYKCYYCDASFITPSNREIHIRSHTGEKPFKCDMCGAEFKQKPHLIKHMCSHTKEAVPLP